MSFFQEFKHMIHEYWIFLLSVIINIGYVIENIGVMIYGLFFLPVNTNPVGNWWWSNVYHQYIASGCDFSIFLRSAYNILFNVGQLVNDPLYLASTPFRDLPLVSYVFTPFLLLGFNIGYVVWTIINFGIECYLSARIYHYLDQKGLGTKTNIIIIGLVIFFNQFAYIVLSLGQTIFLCELFYGLLMNIFKKIRCWHRVFISR